MACGVPITAHTRLLAQNNTQEYELGAPAISRRLVSRLVVGLVFAPAFAPLSAVLRKDPLLNRPAPAFARTSLDHQPVDLAALRGRVVLLNFWATWCASCKVEMPRFVEWQQKYSADGLSIVGVSMDDDPALALSLVQKFHLTYPVIMGDEKLGLAYGGVLGLPVTYLIDRRGVIRSRYQGETNLDVMESVLRRLLQTR